MNPNDFYQSSDIPAPARRRSMWRAIEQATRPSGTVMLAIRDRRSFLYGMAASLLLLLSGIGAYSVLETVLRSDQPQELRFDEAYRSAIQEFERVLPAATRSNTELPEMNLNLAKRQQLVLIDAAIKELREDIARTDLSPLKRSRLRQLYGMKLRVLQEIIEQGEIEL